MPHYRSVGDVPRKRHVDHRQPDGSRYHEELMGQEGFASSSALLYHRHSPSAVVAIEAVGSCEQPGTPDVPLVPRHLRTGELPPGTGDLVTGRHELLANADVAIGWVVATEDSPLYRNAAEDELLFVQSGAGTLESVFGPLDVGEGDYVVVPAGTTHRWAVAQGGLSVLVVRSAGHVSPPKRYLSAQGQFLEHAPYCERDLRMPTEPLLVEGTDVDVLVRNRAGLSRHTHRHHPFDVAGWDGCLYPWAFSISDFEPIVGRIHQPPPVHQTFEGPGFVVCSFVPRLFDFHPDAIKVPYHHANTDSDEVLFYADGNFMSRAGSGIGVGSISYHPAGFVHGPQPGSIEASLDQDRTEETAVMIDTFAPLAVTDAARAVSDPAYPASWSRSIG
ncbi:MAG: cupin domain-containing protein [Actinomycetota bacterium]